VAGAEWLKGTPLVTGQHGGNGLETWRHRGEKSVAKVPDALPSNQNAKETEVVCCGFFSHFNIPESTTAWWGVTGGQGHCSLRYGPLDFIISSLKIHLSIYYSPCPAHLVSIPENFEQHRKPIPTASRKAHTHYFVSSRVTLSSLLYYNINWLEKKKITCVKNWQQLLFFGEILEAWKRKNSEIPSRRHKHTHALGAHGEEEFEFHCFHGLKA